MKYVSVALTQPPDERHPMHEFVMETAGYEVSRLLEMNVLEDGHWTALFEIVGRPIEPYEAAIEATDDILEYAISPREPDTFYLYTLNAQTEENSKLVGAARQRGLVVVGPIEFRADGTIHLTIVAPGEVVQQTIEDVPDAIGVEVESIGQYDAHKFAGGGDLTARQYEAIQAGVECGYYEEPRSGSVADVADHLDVASGTAAELLRRAEAAVMREVVTGHASPGYTAPGSSGPQ